MITNEIIENCTKVIKENGQKIFFAVMTMLIVSHFSLIIAFGFVMLLSAVSSLLTFALLAVILVFTFGLFFGFCVLMLLFTRSQYGVIGHLFYGFKDLKRLLRASLPFVLILFGSAKIPAMARNIANGIKTFKQEIKEEPAQKSAQKKKNAPVKKSK